MGYESRISASHESSASVDTLRKLVPYVPDKPVTHRVLYHQLFAISPTLWLAEVLSSQLTWKSVSQRTQQALIHLKTLFPTSWDLDAPRTSLSPELPRFAIDMILGGSGRLQSLRQAKEMRRCVEVDMSSSPRRAVSKTASVYSASLSVS